MTKNSDENKKKVSGKTGHSLLLDGVAWFFVFILFFLFPALVLTDPNMQDPKIHQNKFTSRVFLEFMLIPLGAAGGVVLFVRQNKLFSRILYRKPNLLSVILWRVKIFLILAIANVLIMVAFFR